MANNYTQFCMSIVLRGYEQQRWVKAVKEISEGPEDVPYDGGSVVSEEEWLTLMAHRGLDGSGICDISIENDAFYLYSEEQGNTDFATDVAQLFLRRFTPKASLCLEVAYTCSRSRPGEFGGAACFITAEEQKWFSTLEWLQQQSDAHAAKKEGT